MKKHTPDSHRPDDQYETVHPDVFGPQTETQSKVFGVIHGGAELTRATVREGTKAVHTVSKGFAEAAPYAGGAVQKGVQGVAGIVRGLLGKNSSSKK